jgi:DNA-binding transcriptional LysR family regulator
MALPTWPEVRQATLFIDLYCPLKGPLSAAGRPASGVLAGPSSYRKHGHRDQAGEKFRDGLAMQLIALFNQFFHSLIGYIDDLLLDQDLRFMDELHPGLQVKFRTSTVIAQMNAMMAGSGIGVIPYFMAHGEEELRPVLPNQSIERVYWLQVNPDSKHIARVRASIDFIVHQIESDKDLFLALPER